MYKISHECAMQSEYITDMVHSFTSHTLDDVHTPHNTNIKDINDLVELWIDSTKHLFYCYNIVIAYLLEASTNFPDCIWCMSMSMVWALFNSDMVRMILHSWFSISLLSHLNLHILIFFFFWLLLLLFLFLFLLSFMYVHMHENVCRLIYRWCNKNIDIYRTKQYVRLFCDNLHASLYTWPHFQFWMPKRILTRAHSLARLTYNCLLFMMLCLYFIKWIPMLLSFILHTNDDDKDNDGTIAESSFAC